MSRARCTVFSAISILFISSAAWALPAVTVSPLLGPPTTSITVTGTGFGVAQPVDIYFDTADVCLSISDAAGKAVCTIQVPKDAQPQRHWITALQRGGQGAQKAFTVRTDMPQFHGRNAMHNGVNPFENTLNRNNVGDLDVLWQRPIGVDPYYGGSPVVAGGKIFMANRNSKLFAFDATTGTPAAGFPVTLGGPTDDSAPAVSNGAVYIGAGDGKLYAFNTATGAPLPGFVVPTLGGPIKASPALALGNVYVGCTDGKLYAFNARTGTAVPGFPVTVDASVYLAAPTVVNGNVYIGSKYWKLYGFNATTGASLAGFPIATGETVYSTAAAAAGTLYFGSGDHKLYAVSASSGARMPGFPVTASNSINSSPAIAAGSVIFGSNDGQLYSYRRPSGALNFSFYLEGAAAGSSSSPMVANGVIYIASAHALNAVALDGTPLWSAAAATTAWTNSPVVANGIVYYADSDGFLTAYSVNGLPPSARLPGGALGVKPALSVLKPDPALKPGVPRAVPVPADAE